MRREGFPLPMELIMKTFLNLKIGVRLAVAFAFVLVLLVAVVVAGLTRA